MSADNAGTETKERMTAEEVRLLSPHRDGISYRMFLLRVAQALEAKTYFEIGTASGASLMGIGCHAVAVDPQFQFVLNRDIVGKKPSLLLFQQTSDDFFANYRLNTLYPAPGVVDFAFLDGLHHFEFLLRDFLNTEPYCHRGSVIALHDCVPIAPSSATRRGHKGIDLTTRREVPADPRAWTGDVWKVVRALQTYRPDLKLSFYDAPPTGLCIVQGLDPSNTVLRDKYDEIVARFMDADRETGWYDTYLDSITLLPSAKLDDTEAMKAALAG
jgi:hypothetical protein